MKRVLFSNRFQYYSFKNSYVFILGISVDHSLMRNYSKIVRNELVAEEKTHQLKNTKNDDHSDENCIISN